jgi:predicted AlkP superfamily phosphohydrolase/phosphomutase
MKKGCWGRLSGPEMFSEQGLWFALFNGIPRSRHGYYYFRQLKPGTYDIEQFSGLSTQEQPFWAFLGSSGIKFAQIDVPDACPVPGIPGWQLMDWALHPIQPTVPATTLPPELIDEVRQIFGPRIVIDPPLNAPFRTDVRQFHTMLRRIEKKGELCLKLLERHPVDLFVAVFAETHTGSHLCWRYRPEAPPIKGLPQEHELTHGVRDIYQAVDRQLGRIMERLPADANIFITSTSGMEDHYPSIGIIESFCRRLGYQADPEPAAAKLLTPLEIVRRILPDSVRVAISRHLPRHLQNQLVADNFRNGTDWSRTIAFSIPAHYNSFLRLNQAGREPRGTVQEGAGREEILKRLEDDLSQLVDPISNQSPVRKVFRSTTQMGCSQIHPALPDLVVQWKPCQYFRQRLHHPKAELWQPVPGFYRDSEHSDQGFIAAAGPGIPGRGDLGEIDLLDMAPTFLAALGQPVPERMVGRPVAAFVRR